MQIITGDALEALRHLPDGCVSTCVTSPPYFGLRDYGAAEQIGLEQTPEEYVQKLVDVFREVRRVLRDDGTLWLNIGDSYAGSGKGRMGDGSHHRGKSLSGDYDGTAGGKLSPTKATGCKPKDLIGIPWMLAFALRADGWYLRQDIIWQKTNCMPESVRDRCTKSHEYIFLLSKMPRYFFDAGAISEPIAGSSTKRYLQNIEAQKGSDRQPGKTNGSMKAVLPRFGGGKYGDDTREEARTKSGAEYVPTLRRNKRDVWAVSTAGYKGAHFATFPEKLVLPCILAGSRPGDTVLDPFAGSGTTGVVAVKEGRDFIGIELNPAYSEMCEKRITAAQEEAQI